MRVWGRGDGHCPDVTHWKDNSVYCTHFLPHPEGTFIDAAQRLCQINHCWSLHRQMNTFSPSVHKDQHRNCYSLILHVIFCALWFAEIFTTALKRRYLGKAWALMNIVITLHVLAVAAGKRQSSHVFPVLKVCMATRNNSLSCLLVRSGSSPA